eukprot:Filipodium_phascolosomae@DN120_c0_g1_i1.p1
MLDPHTRAGNDATPDTFCPAFSLADSTASATTLSMMSSDKIAEAGEMSPSSIEPFVCEKWSINNCSVKHEPSGAKMSTDAGRSTLSGAEAQDCAFFDSERSVSSPGSEAG